MHVTPLLEGVEGNLTTGEHPEGAPQHGAKHVLEVEDCSALVTVELGAEGLERRQHNR
jgi:hypothetical protein